MELKVAIIGNELIRIGQSANSFIEEIKTLAGDARVQAIAAEFPGGAAADAACIQLCTEAVNGVDFIIGKIPGAEKQVEAIYDKLKADIAQVKHNNPKHTPGYYIKLIGIVMEDIANSIAKA